MTIRTRLALLFTVAALALLAGGAALFVKSLRDGLEQNLDGQLTGRADTVVADLHTARMANLDNLQLRQYRLPNTNGIYAQLLAPDGSVFDRSHGLVGPLLSPARAGRASSGPMAFDSNVPIADQDGTTNVAMRVYARPSGRSGVVLAVAVSREVVDKAVSRATEQLLILCAVVFVLAGPTAWLLARAALRPVELMRRQVARMRAGEIGTGVAVPRARDEIGRLAVTFNGLLGRLHSTIENERTFLTDAGHELRTPLAVLKGELELAQRPGRSIEALHETIAIAAEETDRIVRLAEDLLLLARDEEQPALRMTHFDLVPLIEAAVRAIRSAAQARTVTIRFDPVSPLELFGEPDRLRRAIDNLLTNAVRMSPVGGTVAVSVEHEGQDVRLTVADSGPGFPPEFIPIAFDRFTRAQPNHTVAADAPPDGNGLGLTIVRSVMSGHGGSAAVANAPGGGAVVTLRWPVDASVVDLRPLL